MQGSEQGDSAAGIVLNALSEYFDNSRDRLYQVSTSSALVEGVGEAAWMWVRSANMATSGSAPSNTWTGRWSLWTARLSGTERWVRS
nr:hypothetical protein [Edaphobacter aggregans]